MNDIINIKEEIESKIKELNDNKMEIKYYGEAKSKAIVEYDKQIAIVLLQIRNGDIKQFDGIEIDNCPVSILDKVAKGYCWKAKLNQEMAENNYKGLMTMIETNGVILSALQTLYRRLDNV